MNIWVWDHPPHPPFEPGNTLQQGADRLWRSEELEGGNPVQPMEKLVLNVSGVHHGEDSLVT